MKFPPEFYDSGWSDRWEDMKIYGPTARHTRRFVFSLIKQLKFNSVFDAGCGTGLLLQQILEKYPHVELAGSEYSAVGLEIAKQRLPTADFYVTDLAKNSIEKKYDLVTCIDVLEHIEDDNEALKNLAKMTAKFMILSVPLGPLFPVEVERMGHVHGYKRVELEKKIRKAGFEIVKAIQWGFPFYNFHRRLVNSMPEETTTIRHYSKGKKFISNILYALFYLNIAPGGERYYALCRPA